VSAVDSKSGSYRIFDEKTPYEELATALISSGSMPAVFPPRNYLNDVLMDGGTVWNTNIASAIHKCLEIVDDPSKVIVDIAICTHAQINPENSTSNTIGNFLRYRSIKKYYSVLDDVLE